MTNQDAWKLYDRYLDGWKAISAQERTAILAEVLASDVQYSTPKHLAGGRQTIVEDMESFQSKFPGGRFDIGDVSAHHHIALLTWVLVRADGSIFAKGHDQISVSPDGKITGLITFAPSLDKP